MHQFIEHFSPQSLASFFSTSISSFVPRTEKLDYIISDTGYSKFSELTKIGEASFDNSDELIVFSCKYDGPLTERSSRRKQFEIAKKVLKDDFKDGAIFVYHDQYRRFRFSFVRKNYGEKGEKRYSSWKRYTYFVDPAETNKTFRERIGKCAFSDLENIQEAFSVEKLTKDFYNRLFQWFQWTVSEEVGITYPNDTTIAEDDREKLEVQVIRLITRLLFVWFIKQKNLVPASLFDQKELSRILKNFDGSSRTDGTYYNAILQNLFFATLNKAVDERAFAELPNAGDLKTLYRYAELFDISKSEVLQLFGGIPFLNGGLFECLDKENADGKKIYLDGFSRNDTKARNGNFRHRAFIPNCVFFDKDKGLIPLLQQYNFTVEENAPDEVQVALDPELLGNVFENLLGAFNKETRDTARKQSGSFYTPKEIVNYMVDESLVTYLIGKVPEAGENLIRSLFSSEDLPHTLLESEALREKISTELKSVKILDPACGSGAFPMGILNQMIHVLQKLDIADAESVYNKKLHLIERCIYGVDIQPIATQICKLRFFISLVVEQEAIAMEAENYGVRPLPNLETKFVSANTLIAPKQKPAQQRLFENPLIDVTKRALLAIRRKHFYAGTADQKKQLREDDVKNRDSLLQLLQEEGDFAPHEAMEFAKWNPYDQNEVSSFFDVDWMFGLTDGFDIVIGNPPYISTKGISSDFKKLLEEEYKFADDAYSHFFFKGITVLKEDGVLSYITPKTFWTTQTKRNLRDLLLSKTIRYIYDTANPFEAAMVDTCITSIVNKQPDGNTIHFLDGSQNLRHPVKYEVAQEVYCNTQNSVIFKPTDENMRIFQLYGHKVKELYSKWWDKISTSKNIDKNKEELEAYRQSLKPGDIALLGCLTEGGQGLATANNGKYIAVRKSTKWANNIIESRPKKLADAIREHKIEIDGLDNFPSVYDFVKTLTEVEIVELFDDLKEKYGRDIFGQGYIYRLVEDSEMANVDELTVDEKENGIDKCKRHYVPYDKGDKDGNRWYLETPFAIAWHKENVGFLRTNSGKKGEGMPVVRNSQYYFKEGFCWSNVLTTYIKCRLKQKTVHSTESMSLFSAVSSVPEYYMICLINSRFIAYYIDSFVNSTSHCTTGDAKLIPVHIPRHEEMIEIKKIFDRAITIKLKQAQKSTHETQSVNELDEVQKELDSFVERLYGLKKPLR